MKKFIGFVKKEFYHIFRDYRTILILFGMPAVQILLFGYVIRNEIKDVKIAILDQSKDEITTKITSKILSSGYFNLVENLESYNQIDRCFKTGEVREVVVFESNFSKKLEQDKSASVQIITDASDPNMATMIYNYTVGIIQDYASNNRSVASIPIQIKPEVRMYYNPDLRSVFMFVPGIMALILMLVSAMMTSISITKEKEFGTMEALLVSPLQPYQIVIGKVTPYVLLSFINAITILIMGYFVFGLPIKGSILLLLSESILYIFLALSIGIFISTIAPNQQVAMFISMFALMLPTMLLSGFIFPIENMPSILQWICYILPPRYFIIIIKNIMLKGTDFMYVWKETIYLIGMIFLFLIISIKKFKTRLE